MRLESVGLVFTSRPHESLQDGLSRVTAGTEVVISRVETGFYVRHARARHAERVKRDPRLRHATSAYVLFLGKRPGLRRALRNTGMSWTEVDGLLNSPF